MWTAGDLSGRQLFPNCGLPNDLLERRRIPFRPLILAANEPRFVVDLNSAGGLSGHLFLGLSFNHGPSKWLHQFGDLDVRYVHGRMEYMLHDAAFPGVVARLAVMPLAESVGLVVRIRVEGLSQPGDLVWAFGGASGFATCYAHDNPHFRFAPDQCADNAIRWENGRFTLFREQTAVLRGGSSWSNGLGWGCPKKVMDSPMAVCGAAQWCSSTNAAQEPKRVAVQKVRLGKEPAEGWIVVGRGGKIESFLADPREAERRARAQSLSIAQRITVHTPDAYLNQAMPMMAMATDGIWGDAAMVHGGWSWRIAFLGWRIWYGPLCYGWTDRVKRSIEQHCRAGLDPRRPRQGRPLAVPRTAQSDQLQHERGLYRSPSPILRLHQRR